MEFIHMLKFFMLPNPAFMIFLNSYIQRLCKKIFTVMETSSQITFDAVLDLHWVIFVFCFEMKNYNFEIFVNEIYVQFGWETLLVMYFNVVSKQYFFKKINAFAFWKQNIFTSSWWFFLGVGEGSYLPKHLEF